MVSGSSDFVGSGVSGGQLSAAAAVLSSPEAGSLLEAALATAGLALESWQLDALHARPGAETSAAYDVAAGGERLYLVASTAALDESERARALAVRLASDVGEVFVWRHPFDPRLPGLAAVCTAEGLAATLTRAGIVDGEVTELSMLVLRPMRRAVLRAEVVAAGETTTLFVKVLRPKQASALLQRHLATPLAPRAWEAGEGVLVTEQAQGRPLIELLYTSGSATTLDPQALIAALDTIEPQSLEFAARRSPTDLIAMYADAAIHAGWEEGQVRDIEERVTIATAVPPGPIVATHGDFHAANVFVSHQTRPEVVALIDVDTVGPGYRADDLACMLAHLHTLPTFDPVAYASVPGLVDSCVSAFTADVTPDQLRARAAAVLVSLLTGCDDRTQGQAWLDTASALVRPATDDPS
jgi:hypothetical protein